MVSILSSLNHVVSCAILCSGRWPSRFTSRKSRNEHQRQNAFCSLFLDENGAGLSRMELVHLTKGAKYDYDRF